MITIKIQECFEDTNGNVVGHVIGNNTVNKYLVINDGDAIDTILNAAIADLRATATANRGRMACITIPSGNYTMSSTTATITLEPWVRLKTDGNVRIAKAFHAAPFFWVRNDIDTSLTVNAAYENNNSKVIDASNGTLLIEASGTAGSCGIRIGNGDGVWGTAYAGNVNYNVAFAEFSNIVVLNCDSGLEFTNNCAFCLRFKNIRLASNQNAIKTSSATVSVNAMEQSSFIECFLHDSAVSHLSLNGGTASVTSESGHEFSFYNCSFTYSNADNILVNSASKYRIEFSASRVEGGNYIVRSTVLSKKSWFLFSNTHFIPTKLSASLAPHLRTLFKSVGGGDDYIVKLSNVVFDATPANFSTPAINTAANYFLSDTDVNISYNQISASEPPGTVADNGYYRTQPIVNEKCFLNINSGFESALLTTGWTTAVTGAGAPTWSRTTTAGEFYSGTAGAKFTTTTGTGSIESENIPVVAGRAYFGNTLVKVSAVAGNLYLKPEIEWFDSTGTTSLGIVTAGQSTSGNLQPRIPDGWVIHVTGTMRQVAPAGARFAKLRFYLSAASASVAPFNGTVFFDQMGLVEL